MSNECISWRRQAPAPTSAPAPAQTPAAAPAPAQVGGRSSLNPYTGTEQVIPENSGLNPYTGMEGVIPENSGLNPYVGTETRIPENQTSRQIPKASAKVAPQPQLLGGPADDASVKVGDYRFNLIAQNCYNGDTGEDLATCMKTSITAWQGGNFDGNDQKRISQYIAQNGSASTEYAPASEGLQAQMDACGTDTACRDQVAQTMRNWGSGGIDQAESGGTLPYPSQGAPTPVRATEYVSGGIYDNGYQVGQRDPNGPTADLPPTFKTGWGWFDRVILQVPDSTPSAEQPRASVRDVVQAVPGQEQYSEPSSGFYDNQGNRVADTVVPDSGFQQVPSCYTGFWSFLTGSDDCARGGVAAEQPPAPVGESFVRPNVPLLDVPQQDVWTEIDIRASNSNLPPPNFGSFSDQQIQGIGDRCQGYFALDSQDFRDCVTAETNYVQQIGLPPPDGTDLPGTYQQGITGFGESFIKEANYVPDNNYDYWGGYNNGESSGVIQTDYYYEPDIFDNSLNLIEAYVKPAREFSTAESPSGLPENQSLAASVFSAFLFGR